MSVLRWLAKSLVQYSWLRRPDRKIAIRRRHTCPSLTILEDRLVPALLTVNSLADGPVSADSSTLTLREAIALIDTGGTAADSSGHGLAASKATQIDVSSPFGSNDTIGFVSSLFSSAQTIILTDGSLVLDHDVSINAPGTNLLAISGDDQSTVLDVASGATVGISGLTIESGAASGRPGGGIDNDGTLTLTESTVSGNTDALGNGGGIDNDGTLTLVNSTVSGNTALDDAGLYNTGTVTLTESTVSGNAAISGNGAIGNYGGAMTLTDCTITGNSAFGAGGIGNYESGTMTLLNTTVSGNSANFAGGILNSATLTLADSTVSGNGAFNDAGILNNGTMTLTDSIVSGNSASVGNGGIGNYGGALTLINCTVSGNMSGCAGDLGNCEGGTVTLVNTSVPGFSVSLANDTSSTASLTLVPAAASDSATNQSTAGISSTLTPVSVAHAEISVLGEAAAFNTATPTLTISFVSSDSILGENHNVESDVPSLTGSNHSAVPSGDSAGTDAMFKNDSTIPDGSTTVDSDGAAANGEALTLSDNGLFGGLTAEGTGGS